MTPLLPTTSKKKEKEQLLRRQAPIQASPIAARSSNESKTTCIWKPGAARSELRRRRPCGEWRSYYSAETRRRRRPRATRETRRRWFSEEAKALSASPPPSPSRALAQKRASVSAASLEVRSRGKLRRGVQVGGGARGTRESDGPQKGTTQKTAAVGGRARRAVANVDAARTSPSEATAAARKGREQSLGS